MSQQIQITGGAKVRNLEGVLTGTSGVVNALGINVPDGIPQLDGSGKILVSQLPNSVMEYKGTWDASTNTPTLADGTGNAGDVYVCSVAGTVNFGSGPIVFYVGDQVLYSGTIWQRASGSSGSVTSVAVTESGDALTITGSPITTSGTINIGFAGNTGQYINGAGGLTTFPTDNITGSGASGQVTYFNGTNTITSESSFNYDASTNRLGVNTSVPNATIGANAATDSGYSLLLKNDNANYNSIGFATDSTYGNMITADRLGSAPSRNLTLYNYAGFMSLTESGNLGIGLLTPNTGIDIYNSTTSSLWLHNDATGLTSTDGVRLALFSSKSANLRNFDGAFSITAEGDFSIITLGAENFKVNSADGSIYQSKVSDAMLKSVSGVITAAVAGTDYLTPSSLSSYVPYTGATTNVNLGSYSLSAYDLIINHASGSGVAASITKGGNGEALTVVKSSGSGNAASITGGITLLSELNLTTALADAYIASAATWNAKMGGSGVSGRVAYYDGTNSITSQSGFIYDSSSNRLGVNTVSPNATIGANAPTDSIYSLLLKNGDNNYSGIGFATSSVYGNTIETVRLGTAPSRNLTLYNYAGYISITEAGNLGVGILTPNTGVDIYNSTQSQLWLHNNATGVGATDGVRLALFNNKSANLVNFDGALSMTAEGDFSIITVGAENLRVNSANGYIGIGNPATVLAPLHVYNAENAASLLLQTDGSTSYSEIAVRNASSVATSYFRQYSASTTGTDFGLSRANLATFFSNYASNFAIGTQNGGDLILGTANIERMRIAASTGNVVIGSDNTTSNRKLVVYSATADTHLAIIGAAPSVRFTDNFTATYSALFGMATASNNYVIGAVASDFVITYNSANNLIFGNSNTSLEKMRINSSGNLLINTTTDNGANLNVNGVIYGTRARLNNSYDNSSVSLNVGGQTYMDSRTSRLYQTYNLSSMSNYMHIYDPYATSNANGGFSIGASSSITTLPSTSIIHFDGVNNRVGIGTTAPSAALSVVGAATFTGALSGTSATFSGTVTGNTLSFTNGTYTGNIKFGGLDASAYAFDLVYQTNNALRFGVSGGDGPQFQGWGGTAPAFAGQMYFDFGSYTRNIAGRALYFRSMTTGAAPTVLTIAANGAATFSSSVTAAGRINSGNGGGATASLNAQQLSGDDSAIYAGGVATAGSSKGIKILAGTNTSDYALNVASYANSPILYARGDGNVGIGTSSPQAKLQVSSPTNFAAILKVSDTSTESTGIIAFGDGNSTLINVGIWRGAANSVATFGNSLNLGSYSDMVFATGAAQIGSQTERMRIDSSGVISIGMTSNAYARLAVKSNNTNSYGGFNVYANGNTNFIALSHTGSVGYVETEFATGAGAGFTDLGFKTGGVERMRITSVGLLNIGLTGGTGRVNVQANPSNNYQMEFFNTVGGSVGSITVVGGGLNTAYNTSSDYRLKEDLKEYNGLSIISRLKTYDFKWKDTDVRDYGVMAHELAEVLPNYVNGEKDALDESGNIKPQGVDYSKIVPILIKSIQELEAKIVTLESKLN